jgi:predicted Zn-ribbon and HTH transcriptional regulator
MEAPTFKIGDIFRTYGPAYRAQRDLHVDQLKVMSAIERCRTADLGWHTDVCENCGYVEKHYNSCCNRHCPQCQGLAREKWVGARMQELLPVVYFHLVFTIPDLLNRLALVNKQVIYDILFRAAAETLKELGRDPRHLGAEIGFIAILHTWGQNLLDHPHLHCIVPGGGLSEDRQEWIFPRKSKSGQPFLIHVNVLSDLFKKKFLSYLKKAYENDELKFVGEIHSLASPPQFQALIDQLYSVKWVTYCKRPFGGPKQVIEYLGRYTHRVAISNYRIVNVEAGKVTFKWRDYRDNNQEKRMTLDASEFIRRFLLHVLPPGYCKIRYYGIFSTRNKSQNIQRCRELLCINQPQEPDYFEVSSWQELFMALTGINERVCPACGKSQLVRIEAVYPGRHTPP